MKTMILAGVAAAALAGVANAGVITTLAPNNGSGGVFLEITPTGPGLLINSFATYYGSTVVGTNASVEVWVRPGSYAGFTTSNAGWVLHETVTGVAAGTAVLSAHSVFTNPIVAPAGTTTAIYLHSVTTGNGIRYQGTGTTSTSTFINADLTLFTNVSRTGAVPFAGTQFTPRAFSGEINYDIIPAPASLALIGLGGLVAGRRRR